MTENQLIGSGAVLFAWPLLIALFTSGGNFVMLLLGMLGVGLIVAGLIQKSRGVEPH